MKNSNIPSKAPNDAIMPKQAEVKQTADWAASAFAGITPTASPHVKLQVLRQDHNTLHFGQSCMNTPIRVGNQQFKHGLGTHANSEIVASVPPGAKTFKSYVGIDNNYDTQGKRGSVIFSIELAGTEVWRTQTVLGGDEPIPVSIDIPAGVKQITLKVDTTPDGPACDQSDWADAHFLMKDGSAQWLDEDDSCTLLFKETPPFSFTYGGVASADLIPNWKRTVKTVEHPDFAEYRAVWSDPKTGLEVTAVAKLFKDYSAVDWVLYFENKGSADTPILENIQALDTFYATSEGNRPVVLHQLHGDTCGAETFAPYDTILDSGNRISMAPMGGKPSQISAFPFFNTQYGKKGIITAIGWSGQWAASLDREATGLTHIRAGMEQTHLKLHPGEKIRSPRILLMNWQGDPQDAQNRFRRLMLFHYVPQQNGQPVQLPIALQTFDRYISREGWATEQGQLEAARVAHELGCDTYWFDAGWFDGGFPNGAGNWYPKPKEFPNGLRPLGDLCHSLGMKFILWFEPERVSPNTQITKEHPEWVLGGEKGGLFNLGNPDACKWMAELLSKRVGEYSVDIYREDFNMDPLSYWRGNDTPDRQGMTEIRFVEGFYAMWDKLLADHPGLMIDNCASGGRRIDLETCMRSIPLWRSDTNCRSGHPEWNQLQSYALGQYVPLSTAAGWDTTSYTFRSAATAGALCQWDYQSSDFSKEEAQKRLAEVRENQKYWYGDMYTLTPCNTALDQLTAYQFHRADLNEGLILAFRRPDCKYIGITVEPKALDLKCKYSVEFVNDAGVKTTKTVTGKDLMISGIELRPGKPGSSLVVRYKPIKDQK